MLKPAASDAIILQIMDEEKMISDEDKGVVQTPRDVDADPKSNLEKF